MDFATVYAVTEKYARTRLKDEERVSVALVLAWWIWSNRQQDFPPSVYAQLAVRGVIAGRDLPGVRSKFRDIWDRAVRWQGGGMGCVIDRNPGPEQLALGREALAQLRQKLSHNQAAMLDLVSEDWGQETIELAEHLGVSPGRVSQMRREIMVKAKE